MNLGAVDRSTQREVEMFLVAIAKNPPIMNLDGFTNINRELFTAVSKAMIDPKHFELDTNFRGLATHKCSSFEYLKSVITFAAFLHCKSKIGNEMLSKNNSGVASCWCS